MFKRLVMFLVFIGFSTLSTPKSPSAHCPVYGATANLRACINQCWIDYPAYWRDAPLRFLCVLECAAHYADHIAGPFISVSEPSPSQCQDSMGIGFISLEGSTEFVITCTAPAYTITRLDMEYTTDGVTYTPIGSDADSSDGWSVIWDVTGLPATPVIILVSMTPLPGQTPGDEPLTILVNAVINNPDFSPCAEPVPTLTEWGLLVLLALLLGSGIWVAVRRRRRLTVGV